MTKHPAVVGAIRPGHAGGDALSGKPNRLSMSATCVVTYSPRVTAPSRPSRAASRPVTRRVGSTLKPLPPGQARRPERPAGAGAHDAEQASWHDPVPPRPQGVGSALARASAPLREEQTPTGHLEGAGRRQPRGRASG